MLEAVAEVDMVDEPVFKVPAKRKKRGRGKGNKQLKKELSGADVDTLADQCALRRGYLCRYTAEEIKEVPESQGALVHSRFQNVMELDAPSKFFGLERKNVQRRFMHAVRSESGDLVSEPSEIRQQTVGFFSKLFESEQARSQDVEEMFFSLQARYTVDTVDI
ncbi:hypothetical protein SRHO_G00312270 [Serrasalmus rhombeus]